MKQIEDLKLAYRRTFDTDDGATVLADLKIRFAFEQTTFVQGDPHQTAFNEGQRSAILLIARMLAESAKPKR